VTACEHEGCTNEGMPCYLLDDPEDAPSYYFCGEHAFEEGFCPACGGFFAGIGDVDFESVGLCEVCSGDLGEDDEDEDDWYTDEEWDRS
jgi:hypothetical protein